MCIAEFQIVVKITSWFNALSSIRLQITRAYFNASNFREFILYWFVVHRQHPKFHNFLFFFLRKVDDVINFLAGASRRSGLPESYFSILGIQRNHRYSSTSFPGKFSILSYTLFVDFIFLGSSQSSIFVPDGQQIPVLGSRDVPLHSPTENSRHRRDSHLCHPQQCIYGKRLTIPTTFFKSLTCVLCTVDFEKKKRIIGRCRNENSKK